LSRRPLRILFFNRSYWPDFGATGQLLTELAEDLVAHHGFDVTVVTGYPLRQPGSRPAREIHNGVEIVRASGTTFEPRRFAGRAANYVSYFASACAAGLRVGRGDMVVALTDPPIIGLAGLLAARRAGVPFVFMVRDVFPEVAALLEDFRSATVDAVLEQVTRYLLRHADAVLPLGDTMQQRLVAKGGHPGRMRIIEDWADCALLAPGPKDNPFSRAHGLHDRFVVMHAGNIGLSQNLDIVLDAAEHLRARDDIRIVFVGDGARRVLLERRARERCLDHVVFLPYQPRERMGESYAAADVFVVSLLPGLAGCIVPSKVYSILAAGRPYVAAVEEACEVVALTRAEGCGFVVAPGDARALADHVIELADTPGLADRMGARAREVGLRFDRPRQVAKYAELFRELAGRPGAEPQGVRRKP